jgi:hypothetical protein
MADEVCPRCGAKRVASFRFCRECGLDFDSQVDPGATDAPPSGAPKSYSEIFAGTAYSSTPPEAARQRSTGGLVLLILVLLAIVGAGYVAYQLVLR